jgi:hypothetical protein
MYDNGNTAGDLKGIANTLDGALTNFALKTNKGKKAVPQSNVFITINQGSNILRVTTNSTAALEFPSANVAEFSANANVTELVGDVQVPIPGDDGGIVIISVNDNDAGKAMALTI